MLEITMKKLTFIAHLSAVFALSAASASFAHITLEQQKAKAGSTYKAVLRVGHGCDGAPTTTLRVQMPAGVKQAKPMPKAGWELKTIVEKLAEPYDWYGQTITEDVSEIVWSGGSLPDNFYDEFVFRATLPETVDQMVYFKTVQECDGGVHRWIEIPEAGKDADDYKEPAPGVQLIEGKPDH
jgi:uncharacterized protein YcnI